MVRERGGNRSQEDAFIVTAFAGLCPDLSRLFPVRQPLEIDIGCGRGRFLLAKAREQPGVNFIGIDQISRRLQKLDRKAAEAGLENIRLIQGEASRLVQEKLEPGSVSAIYVFFPDPWPKRRHQSRRLISPEFITDVHTVLDRDGVIHICTDHDDYFAAISRLWGQDARFIPIPPAIPTDDQETDFGLLFRRDNRPVNRCSFRKGQRLVKLDSLAVSI